MEAKKYIKISFRKDEPVWLSLQKWGEILEAGKTLVPYKLDNEQEWTGRSMNLSEVTRSEYDREYTEKMNTRPVVLYRRLSTDTIVQMFEGELPDDLTDYEKL